MNQRSHDAELSRRAKIVSSEYGGILPQFEVMYLHSILYATSRSLDAFGRFSCLKDPRENPDLSVGIIQEAVGHAAAVSRFFWPAVSPRREETALKNARSLRGKRLREAFSISDESPLATRNLRNAWEHFDEKLDRYLLNVDGGVLLPGCLIEGHAIVDEPMGYTFKVLDPDAECLVLLGERFFYGRIRDEVGRIHAAVEEAERNGGRLQQL